MIQKNILNKSAVTVKVHTQLINALSNSLSKKGYKKSPFNTQNSNNKHNERNGWNPNTCFRCGSEDHFISNCLKLDTLNKKVPWNMENFEICSYRSIKIDKTSENTTYESESHKIYAYMARMSTNVESLRRDYGDRSQMTNWMTQVQLVT